MSDLTVVHVCTNHALLTDGLLSDRNPYTDQINSALSDVCRFIDDSGIAVSRCESFHADWAGGKFYRPGNVIAGKVFGYRCGHVCTLQVNPGDDLRQVVDDAGELLAEKLSEICRRAEFDDEMGGESGLLEAARRVLALVDSGDESDHYSESFSAAFEQLRAAVEEAGE